MLILKILGEPKAKQSFRYAIRPNKSGKNFVSKYQPKDVVQNERNLAWDIKSQLQPDFKPFDCPVEVSLIFVFPPLKSWSKSEKAVFKAGMRMYKDTKPDLDNLEKSVFDAMQGVVYINDSRVCEKRSKKVYGDTPRIEIVISALDPTKPTA